MDNGFKFQVRWDGRVVVGVTKVSALKRSTEVIEHREGGDPGTSRKSPGLTKFQPIVLKRGVTHDPEFENWANLVYQSGAPLGAEVSLKNFRKTSRSSFSTRLDRWCLAIGCTAAGRLNTQPCPTWMLMQLMFLSSRSFWRTKAGSETSRSLNLKRRLASPQKGSDCDRSVTLRRNELPQWQRATGKRASEQH